ncbi:unnamed protein product [Rotaria sp. Silwood2]|nr:unnamed protein product [Rotaria sp. Silwood2]CAF2886717.1 unnamed protein product [Rotaria sp. Silwood2]CAF3045769.1 unnamed protein product [Rotaria sp. Silwood2]CAF4187931.1 unnamed protein product [Rotaria sp. Silwood2]CAF4450465.1 unnamed protein product [Rotaria sp. Silwood2]
MGTGKTIVLVDGEAPPRFIPSTRFTLALLVCFAFIIQYSQRVNLPIAIVCMVNRTKAVEDPLNGTKMISTNIANDPNNNFIDVPTTIRPILTTIQKRGFLKEKQFNWIELQQQMLLGGYWAGYIFTQVPGGWFATSIGAKWVYACSLSISSTATLALTIMYFMSSTHFMLMFILRFVIGLAHGVLFPATISLWSVWAVSNERSTLVSIGFCGTQFGTSLTMLLGGISCRYLNSGWMYLFFLTSILGFVWFALWVTLTANSPSEHKTISSHERDYICNLTGHTGKKRAMSLASIPWKNIVTSKPLIALIITHMSNLFGLFFFLTNLGKILTELHRVPPQYTGYILSFGFFLTLLTSLTSGILVDKLVRSKIMTLTNARKLFNSITSFVPVLCMISLYFCDASRRLLGIITVLIFLAASGLGYGSGYSVNFADIVPAYSGVIFGIANTFASLAGLIGNLVAGMVVKQPVFEQWRKLFVMFGIVYFIGGLVFLLFGSAVPRKWAKFQTTTATEEKKVNDEEMVPMNENDQVKA